MRLFFTADCHHGINPRFERRTSMLAAEVLDLARPGDALVLGGDLACADRKGLDACLALFEPFPGTKAFVPGNHDLWSEPLGGIGSDVLYERRLAEAAARRGFRLLDDGPLRVPHPGGALGIAGSAGGFDFSLADLTPLAEAERAEVHQAWRTGQFRTAFWNDYRFTWRSGDRAWDHPAFAAACAARLRRHLAELEADATVSEIVCVTHTGAHLEQVKDHPNSRGRPLAGSLWLRGLSGSSALGDAIRASPKTRLAVCGHTHHERRHADSEGRLWINIGCDYPRKRWLVYEPGGEVRFTSWIE